MYRAEKEAEAAERMKAGVANPTENFPEGVRRETRDELGEMAGMSGRTRPRAWSWDS